MVASREEVLHGGDGGTSVRKREHRLKRDPILGCPPAPGAFDDNSRIDQSTVHVEEHRLASQVQVTYHAYHHIGCADVNPPGCGDAPIAGRNARPRGYPGLKGRPTNPRGARGNDETVVQIEA